jgi:hypothetical protein
LNTLLKLLVALALLLIVIVFLCKNWTQIQQWWAGLFGSPKVSAEGEADDLSQSDSSAPPLPFASFRNPIGTGLDERKVVVITFQALEAWAREHGASRRKEETPNEFLRRAAKLSPQFSGPVSQIVDAYNRVVYGKGRPTPIDLQAAAQVWQVMQST